MKKYIEYASEIYAIYLKYMDKSDIHVYSIDECIIDATDYLKIYNKKATIYCILNSHFLLYILIIIYWISHPIPLYLKNLYTYLNHF